MLPVVCLKAVIEAMDRISDETKLFLNIRTGKLVLLTTEELDAAEAGVKTDDVPEWQRDMIQEACEVLSTDDYLALPDRFDIHEYAIMERFCHTIENNKLRHRLLQSIQGRGAFRRFRDTLHEFGIVEIWYAWREEAFKEIAIEWLESHGIAYEQ